MAFLLLLRLLFGPALSDMAGDVGFRDEPRVAALPARPRPRRGSIVDLVV